MIVVLQELTCLLIGLTYIDVENETIYEYCNWIKSYCRIIFPLSSNCSSSFLHVASAVFFSATAYPWLIKFKNEKQIRKSWL